MTNRRTTRPAGPPAASATTSTVATGSSVRRIPSRVTPAALAAGWRPIG